MPTNSIHVEIDRTLLALIGPIGSLVPFAIILVCVLWERRTGKHLGQGVHDAIIVLSGLAVALTAAIAMWIVRSKAAP